MLKWGFQENLKHFIHTKHLYDIFYLFSSSSQGVGNLVSKKRWENDEKLRMTSKMPYILNLPALSLAIPSPPPLKVF